MAETVEQWWERVSTTLAEKGYREDDLATWDVFPYASIGEIKPLRAPGEEKPRHGAEGVDCHSCQTGRDLPPEVIWHDEHYYVVWARESSLPFAAFLMPREHADLADLSPEVAARGGELLALIERAAIDTTCVPRIQVARWGDGGEHLHWWLYGRPAGLNQLRGTFLAYWDDLLPSVPDDVRDATARQFGARLAELAGGISRP